MPTSAMIWSEAWARASREELGIYMVVVEPDQCIDKLYKYRPAEFKDYSVTRTQDPNIIYIIKPGITLDDEVLAQLSEDLTQDLED